MNIRDSEIILGMLQKEGYVEAASAKEADAVIFNTCSVRKHAEDRVWSNIGMINKKGGRPIVGVVGCMAQNYQDKMFKRLSQIDFVCGPANIYDIPDLLEKVDREKTKALAVDKAMRPLIANGREYSQQPKAFVSIMYGCNNFCSYCIVPYVRGRERSRPVKHIVDEVRHLVDHGCCEVTLLGQNVNSYKRNLGKKVNFIGLLERLNKIERLEHIHFMTSHPKDATVELFRAMRDLDKVEKQLHLPLQSGADRILKLMNRGYTARKYIDLTKKIRELVPGCKITTDIIVGFPTETDTDFKKTYKVMSDIKFNAAYIFKYSPRPPAKSAFMQDDVSKEIKQKRHQAILNLQKKISKQHLLNR